MRRRLTVMGWTPTLIREYRIMPWDIDGRPGLTEDELVAVQQDHNRRVKAENDAALKARLRGR